MRFAKAVQVFVLFFAAVGLMGLSPALERLAVAKSELIDPVWTEYDASSEKMVDYTVWNQFLSAYVRADDDGVTRVAYRDVTEADEAALNTFVASLENTDPATLSRYEQLAFWVNLYNAKTVALVLEYCPVSSIRKIKFNRFGAGPWNEPLVTVKGRPLTLNNIESGIVRPIWNDARIHYVFNCAAFSCPNLGLEAYTGTEIDAQMDAAGRAFVNDPRGVRIEADGDLILSKVFAWYRVDYGRSEASILDHVRQYAAPQLKAALEGRRSIDRYEYDWALNDAATGVFTQSAASSPVPPASAP